MHGRSFRSTRQKPQVASITLSFAGETALPPCDHPGCAEAATHRAPRSRWPEQHGYYGFCLEHVRAYNERWDYYSGMSLEEIELSRRNDVTWNRPTWGFGGRSLPPGWHSAALRSAFERMFGDEWSTQDTAARDTGRTDLRMAADLRAALDLLEISSTPVTFAVIKQAYKRQAKQSHPDLSGNDPQSEERFKAVNEAYALLKKHADLFPAS